MPTSNTTTQHHHHHHHHTNSRSKTHSKLLKLGSILPPSSTNLQIKLIEPILYFRGNSEESVGCFLRGDLILNLSKPTKIRKIEMKFSGRMKTFWPEGKLYHGSGANRNELCEKQEIITHSWMIVSPPTSSSNTQQLSSSPSSSGSNRFSILRSNSLTSNTPRFHLIPAGVHKYPFELFIPGNLPETIEAERGTVHYKLSAIAVRSGLCSNLYVLQHVPIIRTVLEESCSEGVAIASNWKDQLDYEITIPKKAYPIGDSIEIDLKLTPRVKKIQIVGVKIQIDEESIYKTKGQRHISLRTLSANKADDFSEQKIMSNKNDSIDNNDTTEYEDDLGNLFYHKNILFPIPKCTSPIHYSCETTSIKISHQLKFNFMIKSLLTVSEEDKKKKTKIEVEVDVPITILSCRCADDLPQYEDEYCSFNEDVNHFNSTSTRIEGYHNSSSEFPPSYEQSTDSSNRRDYLRRQTIQEFRPNDRIHPPPLERLLTY